MLRRLGLAFASMLWHTSWRREEMNRNMPYSFLFSCFGFHGNMRFGGEAASIRRSPCELLIEVH